MKVTIVGSRSLDPLAAQPFFVKELAALPEHSEIQLRKPTTRPARVFEMTVAVCALTLGHSVQWWEPGPGGRQATFLRDVAMVEASDEVIAYFTEDEEMTGGTGHVVEKALDRARLCRAYSIVDGDLKWVGGYDPSTEG
jgi:hypothetical protein